MAEYSSLIEIQQGPSVNFEYFIFRVRSDEREIRFSLLHDDLFDKNVVQQRNFESRHQ